MQSLRLVSTARTLCLAAVLVVACDGVRETDGGAAPEDGSLADAATPDAGVADGGVPGMDAAADDDGGAPPSDASVEDAGSRDAAVAMPDAHDASLDDAGPSCADTDGDGAGVGPGCAIIDCDDTDPSRYPGALEVCNLADDDCDGMDDESCVCPLLSVPCAAGCCAADSERVTSGEGNYPHAAVDDDGNLYVAFADPDSLSWRSGLATRTWDSSMFRQVEYLGGSRRSEVRVDATGRVHHMQATETGPVHYRYSDDRGLTWTELRGIPGTLRIGGGCSLDVDAARNPHLYCGFDEPAGFVGHPTYLSWDGSAWRSERLSTRAGGVRTTQMHLDSAGRAQVIHTYGPSSAELHHTRYTGTTWVTEAVRLDPVLQVNRDRRVAFEIDDADGLHVFFTAQSTSGGDYTGYHAHRSSSGVWSFEEAIPSTVVGSSAPEPFIALQADGEPVVATSSGAIARRTVSGTWVPLTSPYPIQSFVLDGSRALVIYQPALGVRPLHVAAVDLFP